MVPRVTRRRFVATTASAAAAALAGCSGSGFGSGSQVDADATTTDTGGLDRREANVVGVAYRTADGEYEFDVTLDHDDEGEEGYANWWQVERLDGTRIARRELGHPHSEQPFTRSQTLAIPDDVTCVVVRGHDRTHGYGGVAMLVNVETGTMRDVDQGSEKRSFSDADCP